MGIEQYSGELYIINVDVPKQIILITFVKIRRHESITARIPSGVWGKPEDLAGAVVFLSSNAANYVNGHVMLVDGGWMAG